MDEMKELKSQAYDLLAAIQQGQERLQQINNKILELHKQSLEKKDVTTVKAV